MLNPSCKTVRFSILALLVSVATAVAQGTAPGAPVTSPERPEPTPAELLARRTVIMAAPVFTKAPWMFDYAEARAEAAAKGKLLFVYCTRSYRVDVGGRQLESGTFSEPAFVEFAKSVVPLCNITSHVEGDKDQGLLREVGGHAFPHLAFLDADGEVLATVPSTEKDRSVARLVELKQKAELARALETRYRAGEKGVAQELLMARYSLHGIKLAYAKELASVITADAKKRAEIDHVLIQIEVQELSDSVHLAVDAPVVGRHFVEMWQQGRIPTGVPARNFFSMIIEAKEADQDAEGFARALDAYREIVKGIDRAGVVVKGYETRLKALEKRLKESESHK